MDQLRRGLERNPRRRSARSQVATEAHEPTTFDAPSARGGSEVRMGRWQRFLIALGVLVVICGVALCVMLAGVAVMHAVKPTRHVDIFFALHSHWVVGVLLGIAVLWLLPPHPWAKRAIARSSREQPAQAGGTEDGDGGAFTVCH